MRLTKYSLDTRVTTLTADYVQFIDLLQRNTDASYIRVTVTCNPSGHSRIFVLSFGEPAEKNAKLVLQQ